MLKLCSQIICIFLIILQYCYSDDVMTTMIKLKSRCLNPPRTARKVEGHIRSCQEEVKNKIILEAFELIRNQYREHENEALKAHKEAAQEDAPHHHHQHLENDFKIKLSDHNNLHLKESSNSPPINLNRRSIAYHPTLVPYEEKRIAGCLLHCVYAKNNAIDKLGWPTLDGLVDFYSEGVNEHGFFMATLRASNLCLKAATKKYHVNRRKAPEKGESCDVAFDVFDCISDQITGYCLDNF